MRIEDVLANGEPPKLVEGLSLNDYLALPHISGSSILKMGKSPLAVKYHHENCLGTTDPMRLGAAVDHLLFEYGVPAVVGGQSLRDAVESFIEHWPVIEGRRQGGEWLSPAERPNGQCPTHREHGVQYVNGSDELATIVNRVTAVCTDPVAASHWSTDGTPQVTLLVNVNGLRVKMRPDWVCEDIDDLKTTADLEDRSFTRTAWNLRYPNKMALYRHGWRELTGEEKGCNLIVVQTKDEPDVAVVPIDTATLMLAEERMLAYCGRIRESIESGVWPGVAKGEPRQLDVPAWEMEEPEFVEIPNG